MKDRHKEELTMYSDTLSAIAELNRANEKLKTKLATCERDMRQYRDLAHYWQGMAESSSKAAKLLHDKYDYEKDKAEYWRKKAKEGDIVKVLEERLYEVQGERDEWAARAREAEREKQDIIDEDTSVGFLSGACEALERLSLEGTIHYDSDSPLWEASVILRGNRYSSGKGWLRRGAACRELARKIQEELQ